jgi:hypothetical protein
MNQHAFGNPPPGTFLTTVSMIFGGVFHRAGEPKPLSELEKIPRNLRRAESIVKHDPDFQSPDEATPESHLPVGRILLGG